MMINIECVTQAGELLINQPDYNGIKSGPWPFSSQIQNEVEARRTIGGQLTCYFT